jgi:hypothetical protein
MTVQEFFDRITYINMISTLIPQSQGNPLLDDHGMLMTAYGGCPKAWKDEFYKQQRSLHNMTYIQLKNFMMHMEKIAPKPSTTTTQYKTTLSDPSTSKDTPTNYKLRNHSQGTPTSSTDTKTRTRFQDTDPCPFPGHQAHSWSNCRTYNPLAEGYCGPSSKGTNGVTSKSCETSKESHFQQEQDQTDTTQTSEQSQASNTKYETHFWEKLDE